MVQIHRRDASFLERITINITDTISYIQTSFVTFINNQDR